MGMLAIVAAIIFAIAWVINATGTATNAWFSVTDLLFIGLAYTEALSRELPASVRQEVYLELVGT